jgi:hypothetical protein
MAPRTIARHLLALLLLLAVCVPYVHAAAEFGQHPECSMEMCKRTGKCCCRLANAGKPHLEARDLCGSHGAQVAARQLDALAVPSGPRLIHALTVVTDLPPSPAEREPRELFTMIHFQRPPPAWN